MRPFFQTPGHLVTPVVLMVAMATGVDARDHRRVSEEPEPPLEEFAVATDGELLLLPVTMDGRTYSFILDTGAALTLYDRSSLLGPPKAIIKVKTKLGNKDFEMFDAPRSSLGRFSLGTRDLVLGCDLSLFRSVSGYDIKGIIGMDFLSQHVVQLNYETGKVSFLRTVPKDAGEPFTIHRQKEGLCVDVKLPRLGRSERFVIDTGSTYFGNMKHELLQPLEREGMAAKVGKSLTAGSDGAEANAWWLVKFPSVAGVEHGDVALIETGDNLLGLGFWSRYIVTFDFPNGVMYLKKSSCPRRSGDIDMSGLHILRVRGRTVVHSVDEGSPAAASGIRPRDVIINIAGDKADELSMLSLRHRLCAEDKIISVTIMRTGYPGEVVDLTVKLRSLPKPAHPSRSGESNKGSAAR